MRSSTKASTSSFATAAFSKSSSFFVVSDTLFTNAGAPQGTVLSPFLFTLYTADGRQKHDSCPIVKFADDNSQIGKISNNDDSIYRQEVKDFVDWCENNFLHLNVSKTKEMIIDFMRSKTDPPLPVSINGVEVERVDAHRYLGVTFDSKLTFQENCNEIMKEILPRMYCLCKLKSFNVNSDILQTFYSCAVDNVLRYEAVGWGGNIASNDRGDWIKL